MLISYAYQAINHKMLVNTPFNAFSTTDWKLYKIQRAGEESREMFEGMAINFTK